MHDKLTGSISTMDPVAAYESYFARFAPGRDANLHDLGVIFDAAVTVSLEVLWPSVLLLAKRAREAPLKLRGGWKVQRAVTGDEGDTTFVMEHDETPGGFVYNVSSRMERLEKGKLEVVSKVACCAYREDGMFPPGYSGYGSDLDETLEKFLTKGYQVGKLFEYRPSIHLQLEGMGFGRLILHTSSPVGDPDMALVALNVLCDALRELGYGPEIEKRSAEIGALPIQHFSGNDASPILVEIGAAGGRNGFLDETFIPTVQEYWGRAAALDFDKLGASILSCIDLLAGNGNTTGEKTFEWQDGAKSAFAATTPQGGSVLFIETQHGVNRLDVARGKTVGSVEAVSLANVRKADPSDATPAPHAYGFIGAFVLDPAAGRFEVSEMGDMTTKNIRDLNHFVSSMSALAIRLGVADRDRQGAVA